MHDTLISPSEAAEEGKQEVVAHPARDDIARQRSQRDPSSLDPVEWLNPVRYGTSPGVFASRQSRDDYQSLKVIDDGTEKKEKQEALKEVVLSRWFLVANVLNLAEELLGVVFERDGLSPLYILGVIVIHAFIAIILEGGYVDDRLTTKKAAYAGVALELVQQVAFLILSDRSWIAMICFPVLATAQMALVPALTALTEGLDIPTKECVVHGFSSFCLAIIFAFGFTNQMGAFFQNYDWLVESLFVVLHWVLFLGMWMRSAGAVDGWRKWVFHWKFAVFHTFFFLGFGLLAAYVDFM